MPRPASRISAAGGIGVVAAQPTATQTAYGQFGVGNYDANLTYNLSAGSRSGSTITVPSANQVITVTAKTAKGATSSPTTTIERKAYTYHTEYVTNQIVVDATWNGTNYEWTCPSGYDAAGGAYGVGVCRGADIPVSVKDGTPATYIDSAGEWWKVT